MARKYANSWSEAAAWLTAVSHTRAGVVRWGVILILSAVWIGGGLWLWRELSPFEAVYRTLSAVGMWDDYFNANNWLLEVVRFAAIATPAVGLLFAFSGQLGRSLARLFNLAAANHVVIAGDSAAALSLALDCRAKKDSVILLAQHLPSETALALRRKGVIVLEGDAGQREVLHAARAASAAHVVAFEPEDTANLQIEAAVRRMTDGKRRRRPLAVHVATQSSMLLKEARELRSMQARKGKMTAGIDPKPFSLIEVAARALVQQETHNLLSLAQQLGQDGLHIVLFGFDAAAEAVAERVLMSVWSAHFQPPRITVLTQDPQAAEAGFRARHREAFAHPHVWAADVAFQRFNWLTDSPGPEVLQAVEETRGKLTAIVVATGSDPCNIHLAIALKRICNNRNRWPVPIFMYETSQSEFSQQYAKGDETEELDAYLQAFGAHQQVATRACIIEGELDRGAAIAHDYYNKQMYNAPAHTMRELQAAMRNWEDVLETYRAANRASADSAPVKIWDAGWRPAEKGEKGETAPTVEPALMDRMAQREHDRWMAERLLSGWRPTADGEARDNELMAHDKIVPWDALNERDKQNDVTQVRAAIDIARLLHKHGFVRRA